MIRTRDYNHVPPPLLWLALALLLSGHGEAAAQQGQAAPGLEQAYFDYSRDPETVVIQFGQVYGELAMRDATPLLRVHGDGSVLVHYPAGMKRAGDYRLRLTDAELRELVGALVAEGLVEFDAESASRARRREQRDEAASTGLVHAASDDTTTLMELRLAAYRAPVASGSDGIEPLPRPVHKELAWYGLRTDARRYPGIEPLQRLAAAQELLLDLARRDDLERIEQPEEGR